MEKPRFRTIATLRPLTLLRWIVKESRKFLRFFLFQKAKQSTFQNAKRTLQALYPFFAKQFHGWVRQLSWTKKVIQIEPFKHDEHAKQKLLLYKGIYFQILLQFFFAKIPFIPQVVMPSWCFSSHISNKRAFLWQFQAQIAAAL